MNWHEISDHWNRMKGRVKDHWDKLTDNDLAIISGRRDQMGSLLQKKYGLYHDQAEREIEKFVHDLR